MSSRDDNLLDTVLYYAGVVLAFAGMALAAVAVIKAMVLK